MAEKKQPKAVSYFDKSKEGGSEENPETDAKKKDPEVKV